MNKEKIDLLNKTEVQISNFFKPEKKNEEIKLVNWVEDPNPNEFRNNTEIPFVREIKDFDDLEDNMLKIYK